MNFVQQHIKTIVSLYRLIPYPSYLSNIILAVGWLFSCLLVCGCLSKESRTIRILRLTSQNVTIDVGFFGICSKLANSSRECHGLKYWKESSNANAKEAAVYVWSLVHPVLLGIVFGLCSLSIVFTILKFLNNRNIRYWAISCLYLNLLAAFFQIIQMALSHLSATSFALGIEALGTSSVTQAKLGIAAVVLGWISALCFFLFALIHLGLWLIECNKQRILKATEEIFAPLTKPQTETDSTAKESV
ncbi:tetraspan protein Dni2 [Schizosaccharomyces japonicus yFS275]|uniref:Tetraspan protein Dni2 n=1 Tax=Schizosaccharomyces japonicus (strain yFS275 / FY16936) TaxID=402676 RepID=B6K284_SCHJY|nr:tetraspan protein Dni2 [Schizosaccharomyces japonicus yFS275]EEB07265.1 tetraspan protein Dni2 [Schizosaccharomyces japonicus yFS275]